MYDKNLLICEGSELSFEELRAKRYFKKYERLRRQQEWGILLFPSSYFRNILEKLILGCIHSFEPLYWSLKTFSKPKLASQYRNRVGWPWKHRVRCHMTDIDIYCLSSSLGFVFWNLGCHSGVPSEETGGKCEQLWSVLATLMWALAVALCHL